MKIYAHYGFNEFIVLCGYKGYVIKEYFSNYYKHMADMTIDLADNTVKYHKNNAEPWKITLVDTGLETMTGGRIKRVKQYIENKPFMLTYGDGVSDIDINELHKFHIDHGKLATITAVQPEGRFGAISTNNESMVKEFVEKPIGDGGLINGGFMVLEPEALDYIEGDNTVFEQAPLNNLAKDGQLVAYSHQGYWKPMDTLRDKLQLEKLVDSNNAPWIKW